MNGFRVQQGMNVFSADGQKLGKVVSGDQASFLIEKGLIFKKDYLVRYDDIARTEGDDIFLRTALPDLEAGEGITERGQPDLAGVTGVAGETRIPLAEEELIAEKSRRSAGEVRVRKQVVEEQRQVTVPVTREEAYVERVPADERTAGADENRFQEGEVVVPLEEEEIEIRKRPVVREEVRVGKTEYQEQQTASGTVRREEVEVEGPEGTRTPGRHNDPNTRR
jgi:uncharacterized protein (TIGR02271 family)